MKFVRSRAGLALVLACATSGLSLVGGTAVSAAPTTGAAFTTVNEAVDGPDHCQNGNPEINCNIYDGKEYVWLNGGPASAQVGDGTYFFAVLEPGGQPGPNDGDAKNLSDDVDAYTNRTFDVAGGVISYGGTHDFADGKIRLADYADTSNPGGVYILAICNLAEGYEVDPRDCKYDAFKVQAGDTPIAQPLSVVKDAAGSYDTKYTWTITKDVDKTIVKQVGGTATFNYTAVVTRDAGTAVNYSVSGVISVFNPNSDGGATIPVEHVTVTDVLSGGPACVVSGGTDVTLSQFQTDFSYTCAGPVADPSVVSNTVTVTWPGQAISSGDLAAGSSSFTFEPIPFSETDKIDDCVTVTDTFGSTAAATLGTTCASTSYPYAKTVPVPSYDCVGHDNTATFTTDDTSATGSASKSVQVCGPARTGAHTIGFWQNKNGQAIITGGAKTGTVCNSATWLRQYAPFQDLSATADCKAVAAYVTNVIKAANASGTSMNSMLKAQMLATALDTYFSDPALGGNKLNAPGPIGAVSVDLAMICETTSCASFENVSSAFGGATSLTVSQLLAYAASQSNIGGGSWYGNVKSTQELAKDTFDAINNQVVFAP